MTETIDAMTRAQPDPAGDDPRRSAARAQIVECDRKLARYRATLDAGGDEATIAGWITETTARRAAAEALLTSTRPRQQQRRMTREEITDLVDRLDDLRRTLRDANAENKAVVYAALGVRMTYRPSDRSLLVEARPARPQVGIWSVSEGGLGHYAHALNQHTSFPALRPAGDR